MPLRGVNTDETYSLVFFSCSGNCTIEQGWYCTDTNFLSTCNVRCGDGLRAGPERDATKCDDGNTVSGDGECWLGFIHSLIDLLLVPLLLHTHVFL
jgi:cysteine-rich repeat protein